MSKNREEDIQPGTYWKLDGDYTGPVFDQHRYYLILSVHDFTEIQAKVRVQRDNDNERFMIGTLGLLNTHRMITDPDEAGMVALRFV